MKKLAIVFAVGAAALLGGSAAHAADKDNSVKAKAGSDVSQQTDFSSHRRNYRHSHRIVKRGYHRSYRQGYGYAPGRYYAQQPQYYGSQPHYYGGGAPGISFSFGGGHHGGGWGHHRGW